MSCFKLRILGILVAEVIIISRISIGVELLRLVCCFMDRFRILPCLCLSVFLAMEFVVVVIEYLLFLFNCCDVENVIKVNENFWNGLISDSLGY